MERRFLLVALLAFLALAPAFSAISISPYSSTFIATAGSQNRITFNVANGDAEPEKIALSLGGTAANFSHLDLTETDIPAKSFKSFVLTVYPPRETALDREYYVEVVARRTAAGSTTNLGVQSSVGAVYRLTLLPPVPKSPISSSPLLIAGIIALVILLLVILIFAIIVIRRKRGQQQQQQYGGYQQ